MVWLDEGSRNVRLDTALGHLGLIVTNHLLNTHLDAPLRLPAKDLLGTSSVRATHLRVVGRHGVVDDLALLGHLDTVFLLDLSDEVPDESGKLEDGELVTIADVDRASLIGVHEVDETVDEVMDVLEGASLLAITIDGDVLALERLDDEVGDNTAVVGL